MAMSGRKTITIKAPVMITSNKVAVWMDEKWMHDFFDFIAEQKFQISGMNHMQNKIKLTYKNYESNRHFIKHCNCRHIHSNLCLFKIKIR